ncbi:MAG: SsrA-binding protein SmpB [Ignavibacteriales bacterium]|nr:SsrA-binding protein SmpB [Ignavibacteriales bacterium]
MPENIEEKNITVNRKASHEFFIINTYEAGIVLQGTEVKSIRQGKINLLDSYGTVRNGEVWLINCHISSYDQGNINNHDPLRERKLLLKRNEIRKLIGKVKEKGLTLVPLRVFIRKGLVKIELAVGKGKKVHDKREDIAKRDFNREQERRIKY